MSETNNEYGDITIRKQVLHTEVALKAAEQSEHLFSLSEFYSAFVSEKNIVSAFND